MVNTCLYQKVNLVQSSSASWEFHSCSSSLQQREMQWQTCFEPFIGNIVVYYVPLHPRKSFLRQSYATEAGIRNSLHFQQLRYYNPFKVLTINVAYFLGNSLYCRTLSHPVSAITGSTKSTGCTTTLGSPMSDIATFATATPNKLPPFKIGHNLQTFSNLVTKYNHQQIAASTFSVASVGKLRRGVTVRRAMSVRSRGSDKRAKYNKYDHNIVV